MSHFGKKNLIVFLVVAVIVIVTVCKMVSIVDNHTKAAKLQEATIDEFVNSSTDEDTFEKETNKRGATTVCGVHGLILLPDNWNGKTFHAGFGDGWNTNVYDTDTWTDMESSGAIFMLVLMPTIMMAR